MISAGIGGSILVSIVAGLATDPFALYHFQRFSIYALASNLAVAPIMSFIVAPAAGIAAVLAPFGHAQIPLDVMAWALDLVAAIGDAFGSRPEAVRALPKPPELAFLLCVAALLWASLWRGWLRLGGVAFFIAAIAFYIAAPRPILAFDADLRAVFSRNEAGAWTLIAGQQRSTFARDRLGQMLGLTEDQAARLAPPADCNEARCLMPGRRYNTYALIHQPVAFAESCGRGALIMTRLNPPASCPHVIGVQNLAREGGGFVYLESDHIRIERALTPNSNRPWTRDESAQE
jgi:competence protein ComEC